jgi:phage terminase large subunit-like protein
LCLGFDEGDEQIAEFWWYWLPEETAKAIRHLIDIDKWRADPRVKLMLTPGKRIDYGYIEATFRKLAEEYKILSLAFDDWNAEKTTQEIEEGVKDDKGKVLIPGTGVPRFNFSQGIKTMNEPTKQFEARVIDGKILHNGDPLTAWMIQNATIKPDANGNYKPLKPDQDSIKKIDGVITGVMTAAMVIQNPCAVVYNTTGLHVLSGGGNTVEDDDDFD